MATKINVYVVPSENTYVIDNQNGFIPAVLYEDNEFKVLIVIPEALKFCFRDKKIEWKVEQFIWNKISEKWEITNTTKFNSNTQGYHVLLVDENSMVNEQGQVVQSNGIMTEIDFYIASLGKPAIYPALQNAIQVKLS